jgi:hypothetical protein
MAAGTYTVYFWRSGMPQVEERSMVIGAMARPRLNLQIVYLRNTTIRPATAYTRQR